MRRIAIVLVPLFVVVICVGAATIAARDARLTPPLFAAQAEGGVAPPLPVTGTRAPAAANSPVEVEVPAASRPVTLTLLAQDALGGAGFHGDVWGHKGFAYIGTWGSGSRCPATGVKIVDLADPAQPRIVGTVAAITGTSQEDIVVRSVSTATFSGDLLAVGIQGCGGVAGRGGLALYNVTDPRRPVELGFFVTGGSGVHELDLVQQGSRVLALLAVPFSESATAQGDFRIVDVSDPRRPVQLSHWGAGAALGLSAASGTGCTRSTYDHSARASADGLLAYLSYWDAGVFVLDISDPARPRLRGQLPFAAGEEGAAHSVAPAEGGRYLLIADEDNVFDSPWGLRFEVQTPSGTRTIAGCESRVSTRLDTTGVIDGTIINAGSGCPGTPLATAVGGKVALVDDSGCGVAAKAGRLEDAGALAVVIGVPGEVTSRGGAARTRIPVIYIATEAAAAVREAAGASGARVTMPTDRRWSGLRIWDIGDLDQPREVGRFQTAGSVAFPPPGAGYYTIHNPLVLGDLAFLSWYTDGLRVVDISDPAAPREVASFVPPPVANAQGAIFPDETLVWGVFVMDDLVLLSDVNAGLYVLRWSR